MTEPSQNTEVEAVPAATVLLLRDDPFEVLMIRRSDSASFVPDMWVFPGGAVEAVDQRLAASKEVVDAMRVCAIRELFEETGIWLGGRLRDQEAKRELLRADGIAFADLWHEAPPPVESLVWTSHWITPVGVPKRFDTYFFLVRVARGIDAVVEHYEAVDAVWISPLDALARTQAGTMPMVFPTVRNLEAIAPFANSADLLASRDGAIIEAVQPRIATIGGRKTIVLSDEP